MSVGQIERRTQNRVVKLFRNTLGYTYLGDWQERTDNRNIEPDLLRTFLERQGIDESLISRALFILQKEAGDRTRSLYDRNKTVYGLLRYGIKIKPDASTNTETVWLVDWDDPENNHFAIAEEVTVAASHSGAHGKRPDIVLYVNGIALGVLELKRSIVSVTEGIRQNIDNQQHNFIEPFFSTMQFVMAGNDTEGMRYGTIETPEKYYLTWKEDSAVENLLDRHLTQLCEKTRFLELIHDFVVFDGGIKKLSRPNQYFGVRAAQEYIGRREGGIIWHTQGSGKSLTMVWLTKWIRENCPDARVLIITDRTELDAQIEMVFSGVNETIYRTRSGADLIGKLNATNPWLICSLIHKFGGREDGEEVGDIAAYIADITRALPDDFRPKGNMFVFVDECHRTQSGDLHKAMKAILPDAVFIGFTGTPLLKADKQRSIEVFGPYIHTYKFDEAVRDKVVLDLRYEARDIDQRLTSPAKVDQWFAAKTQGLTDLAKAQLKQRWGTLRRVLSSQDRLEKIVSDILLDMETRPRLMDGRGNAMLVCASIYQACKLYELFADKGFAGKCAIVTSYKPTASTIKGESTGEGPTEKLRQYEIYREMLANWFKDTKDNAENRIEEFEKAVKEKFIKEPGQMKLLIVVDKLLTGFDAPPATYLYIDKQMRDHGLFQAICRVNRLHTDDKEYGYIVDYKDLFKSLEGAVKDYTTGALDGYSPDDVAGLLKDRITSGRERLEEAREAIKALCEPVEPPKNTLAYLRYFSGEGEEELRRTQQLRLALYTMTVSMIRAYANLANDLPDAGYGAKEIATIKEEVDYYEKIRTEVKIHSKDSIDLKSYEPAMRHLIDSYIRAEESEKISSFDDLSLVQLIVERGAAAVDALPEGIRASSEAVAETIENNVRRLIIEETPINPKYYEKMSELLVALIEQRKTDAIDYQTYLAAVVALAKEVANPATGSTYPSTLDSSAKRALYDNLGKDEQKALAVDSAVRRVKKDGFRGNQIKERQVKIAIRDVLQGNEELTERIFELVKNQSEY